jgi:hypothetical protein
MYRWFFMFHARLKTMNWTICQDGGFWANCSMNPHKWGANSLKIWSVEWKRLTIMCLLSVYFEVHWSWVLVFWSRIWVHLNPSKDVKFCFRVLGIGVMCFWCIWFDFDVLWSLLCLMRFGSLFYVMHLGSLLWVPMCFLIFTQHIFCVYDECFCVLCLQFLVY